MRIGIIGPCEDEIMPFIEKMMEKTVSQKAMLTFYQGIYENVEVVALYCGVCKVNAAIATQILIDRFEVTHLIVTGVAGGIDPNLKIGDTVISTQIAYHDVHQGILTEYHPWMTLPYFEADKNLVDKCREVVKETKFNQKIYFGKIVTGEAFISDEGREVIINHFDPQCVDMETASIAHVCYVNQIPFLAIRSISDTQDESGVEIFENNCVSAAIHSIEIVEKLLIVLSNAMNFKKNER